MQTTYVVIYRDHLTDEVYGWLCHAETRAQTEEKFWKAMGSEEGYTIQAISEVTFSFPWQEEHGDSPATREGEAHG